MVKVPLWLDPAIEIMGKLVALVAFVGVVALLGTTLTYWGGARPEHSFFLYWTGAVLWLNLVLYALIAWARGQQIGEAVDAAVLLFLGYFLWWFYRAPIPHLARWEGLWILTYAAVFFNVRYVFPSRSWGIALLGAVVVFGVVQSGFGLSKLGQHVYEIWGENRPDYGRRISGFFGCPNHFGNFLVLATLTGAVLATLRKGPWFVRILLVYGALMMTAGVVLSVSRGSYLAWLTGFGVLALLWIRQAGESLWIRVTAMGLGLVVLVGAGLGFWFFSQQERSASLFQDEFRFKLFEDAWHMFLKSPVHGFGPATFDFMHQRFHGPEFQSRAYYTHNDYLNTLCDYGAIGLALVVLFIICLVWSFRLPPGIKTSGRQWDLATLGYAVLAASLIHATVDFNFHLPACALTFFTIVGVASSRSPRQQGPPVCLPGNPVFVLVGVGATFWMSSTVLPAQRAWALMPYSDEGLTELSEQGIRVLRDRIAAIDPLAGPLFARLGDAARHQLAKVDNQATKMREAVAAGQQPFDALIQTAERQQALGNLALDLYARAARLNPLDDTLTVKQGMVFDLMGRPEEAYIAYSRARSNQPYNRFFVFIFGYHYLRQGYLEKALEAYQDAARIPLGVRERNRRILDAAREAISVIEAELQTRNATAQPPGHQ